MLQLRRLNREALAQLDPQPPPETAREDGEALQAFVDDAVERLRQTRREIAERSSNPLTRLRARVDELVRVDTTEYMDRPEFPADEKQRLVDILHTFNRILMTYRRFLLDLQPVVEAAARRHGRPARVLELASGAGEFALELAQLARGKGLPVEVTGSDIVPEYVAQASEKARSRGLDVRFVELNAFDLGDLAGEGYDAIFIGQAMHHFSPGQLARMIAQAGRVSRHFLGIDGRRGLTTLGFVPPSSALFGNRYFWHDAVVSARRFYSEPELSLVARLAAPKARVSARERPPGLSLLRVDFGG